MIGLQLCFVLLLPFIVAAVILHSLTENSSLGGSPYGGKDAMGVVIAIMCHHQHCCHCHPYWLTRSMHWAVSSSSASGFDGNFCHLSTFPIIATFIVDLNGILQWLSASFSPTLVPSFAHESCHAMEWWKQHQQPTGLWNGTNNGVSRWVPCHHIMVDCQQSLPPLWSLLASSWNNTTTMPNDPSLMSFSMGSTDGDASSNHCTNQIQNTEILFVCETQLAVQSTTFVLVQCSSIARSDHGNNKHQPVTKW